MSQRKRVFGSANRPKVTPALAHMIWYLGFPLGLWLLVSLACFVFVFDPNSYPLQGLKYLLFHNEFPYFVVTLLLCCSLVGFISLVLSIVPFLLKLSFGMGPEFSSRQKNFFGKFWKFLGKYFPVTLLTVLHLTYFIFCTGLSPQGIFHFPASLRAVLFPLSMKVNQNFEGFQAERLISEISQNISGGGTQLVANRPQDFYVFHVPHWTLNSWIQTQKNPQCSHLKSNWIWRDLRNTQQTQEFLRKFKSEDKNFALELVTGPDALGGYLGNPRSISQTRFDYYLSRLMKSQFTLFPFIKFSNWGTLHPAFQWANITVSDLTTLEEWKQKLVRSTENQTPNSLVWQIFLSESEWDLPSNFGQEAWFWEQSSQKELPASFIQAKANRVLDAICQRVVPLLKKDVIFVSSFADHDVETQGLVFMEDPKAVPQNFKSVLTMGSEIRKTKESALSQCWPMESHFFIPSQKQVQNREFVNLLVKKNVFWDALDRLDLALPYSFLLHRPDPEGLMCHPGSEVLNSNDSSVKAYFFVLKKFLLPAEDLDEALAQKEFGPIRLEHSLERDKLEEMFIGKLLKKDQRIRQKAPTKRIEKLDETNEFFQSFAVLGSQNSLQLKEISLADVQLKNLDRKIFLQELESLYLKEQ